MNYTNIYVYLKINVLTNQINKQNERIKKYNWQKYILKH